MAARRRCCLLLLGTAATADAFATSSRLLSVKFSVRNQSKLRESAVPIDESTTSFSDAATWHRERRKMMLERYGDEIAPLERESSSQRVALPLLILANTLLLLLSILSGSLPPPGVMALAIFPGSMLSLWQLQILHDVLHGSLFPKGRSTIYGVKRKTLQEQVLFWGSMPSVFGYYLYLKFGHLSHHKNVGNAQQVNLKQLFDSSNVEFEDGDVLFVAHRMKLKGDIGPSFSLPFVGNMRMSMSISGFNAWRQGKSVWNACMFASSFLFERFMLIINDVIVAMAGRNYFFPNKPQAFHDDCARYARCATLLRAALLFTASWKSLLFLYLSETLWSLPPHPACAMFVTNHGSTFVDGECVPTSSTYAGRWYSLFTLGTNYHCEHHDFPTIPLHKLGELRKIAPEFYNSESNDNLFQIMNKAFAYPDFYACMDAGIQLNRDGASV